MRLQFSRVVVVGLASLALAACGGGGGGGHETPVTAASITIVSGNNQTAVAGSALPAALGVSVKDSSGRALAGASVSWTVVAGGGSVTPATSTTDSGGLATTNWTLGAAPGANRVTATVAGITPVTFDAMALAGTTASVIVTSPVAKIYEGDTVQLVATAKDAAGNVLPGKSATWSSGNPQSFPRLGRWRAEDLGNRRGDRHRQHRRHSRQPSAHDRADRGPGDGGSKGSGDGRDDATLRAVGRRGWPDPICARGGRGPGDVLRQCAPLLREPRDRVRQAHARLQPACTGVGGPAHCGVLRELGMGVVRVSGRQLVARARAQRVPRRRRRHMPAG